MDDRGFWTTPEEVATHEFDERLCDALIVLFTKKETIVDIGCGKGQYVKALLDAGFDARGFDGNPMTPELTKYIINHRCEVRDFSKEQKIGMYDIVLSLEVGEHIPSHFESQFIQNLCTSSRQWIVLSWAVPGQGGVGHFNERSNMYIISELESRGFKLKPEPSLYLRDHSTLPWFKHTIMVFRYE